jgi:ribosomal protein S18 acetylase RimI-like enzyme
MPGRYLPKLRRAVRREGALPAARRLALVTLHKLVMREEHVWYSLELDGERPRRELPAGFALRTATEADVEGIAKLPNQPDADELRTRLAGQASVYVVTEGARMAFACTVFRGRTPTVAAKSGWLDLPPDTVCLEDSGTSPEFRGRGVAPGAWTALADDLARRGYKTMLTKVEVANAPSRKAVAKSGFGQVASMRMRRVGPLVRVAVTPLGAPAAELLVTLLSR